MSADEGPQVKIEPAKRMLCQQLEKKWREGSKKYFFSKHDNTVSCSVYGNLNILSKYVPHGKWWNFKSVKPVATMCRKVLGFGRGTFVRRGIRHQAR